MANSAEILTGLHEIAAGHDALICDVWGVIHNGTRVHEPAVDALARFRESFGPVVLLSNAPRPVSALKEQFAALGVPENCYDAIVTSGVAARIDLAHRTEAGRLSIFHVGPKRDRGIFEGLPIDCVDAAKASVVLCTGLFDDDVETPADYRALLDDVKKRGLVLLCANPDIVVQRELGGEVVFYGKPYAPIYEVVRTEARRAAGRDIVRPLAIGDGLETDIRGANGVGIEALFIADGIHGEDIGDVTPAALARLYEKAGVFPKAAMRALVW